MMSTERELEDQLVAKLQELKFTHRADIRDRAALEANFRQKFQELNRVRLSERRTVTQIELKALGINPRRPIEQIVVSKNDAINDHRKAFV